MFYHFLNNGFENKHEINIWIITLVLISYFSYRYLENLPTELEAFTKDRVVDPAGYEGDDQGVGLMSKFTTYLIDGAICIKQDAE